jgi:translation initiation factor 3 subunit A
VLETIMFKYVELCIELKKGRLAKDGLIQYRIVCQQVNVNSLEEVIKHFLKLATEKAESAQAAAAASASDAALAVGDLEAENTPENLMLKSVSSESEKDRADRETVTPWFKFLWEAYRTILEILRNNNKLEALYAMTANRACAFCVEHKRTTEFRRLCVIGPT